MPRELLRSWQLRCHVSSERSSFIGEADWGWGGGEGRAPLGWPATAASHRSQWKFIFPSGHISFRIRLDSMLKLIRNYINPIGLTVQATLQSSLQYGIGTALWYREVSFARVSAVGQVSLPSK